MTLENAFKHTLARRVPQIGLWLGLASPYTAEMFGSIGFDWLVIDNEHAPNSIETTLAQLQALEGSTSHAVVRASCDSDVEIKRWTDIGVQTLLIPMIESEEQARRVVSAMRYPPRGHRGVGATLARASRWQQVPDYLHRANDQMCTLLQVESRAGLDALTAICSVDGVDGVFIGPADLAASLGHLGNAAHPEVQGAIGGAIDTIVKSGKAAGILTGDLELARNYLARGATFVAVGSDVSILMSGAKALRSLY
ncbi:aldolase/citrate lyase family protein [Pandoraea pulmonicola]|nr:aldolase/citrate lyase family protein [Pandoraea pulmonicola]APD13546.1 hypothetical protein RO07_23975 [Pandoraea pulmonicola]